MIFKDSNGVESTSPPSPVVYFLTGHFSICLDSTWTFPNFKEWVLQYTEDKGDGVVNWINHTTVVNGKKHYNFIEAHPEYSYSFRYKIRAKGEESPWSSNTNVGNPKVVGVSTTGGIFGSVIANTTYFLGESNK